MSENGEKNREDKESMRGGFMAAGVYIARKKNGEIYFRSSITYRNRHISLGSFQTVPAFQNQIQRNDCHAA